MSDHRTRVAALAALLALAACDGAPPTVADDCAAVGATLCDRLDACGYPVADCAAAYTGWCVDTYGAGDPAAPTAWSELEVEACLVDAAELACGAQGGAAGCIAGGF